MHGDDFIYMRFKVQAGFRRGHTPIPPTGPVPTTRQSTWVSGRFEPRIVERAACGCEFDLVDSTIRLRGCATHPVDSEGGQ